MSGGKWLGLKKPNPGWFQGSSNPGSQIQKHVPKRDINTIRVPLYKRLYPSYDMGFSRKPRGVMGLVVGTPDFWWIYVTSVWIYALRFMGTAQFSKMLSFLFICLEQQDYGYRGIGIWRWHIDVLKWELGNNNLYSFFGVYRIYNIYTSQNK